MAAFPRSAKVSHVRDSDWDSAAFTDLLRRLQEPPARLSPQDIRSMAGISKPQVYRWLQGQNRPQPDALMRLGEALERDVPHAQVTTTDLMSAAGYGPTVRVSQVYVETEPIDGRIDEELAQAINAARRNGLDPGAWDFREPLERSLFLDARFTWGAKRLMHAWLRAAIDEERQRDDERPPSASSGSQ